MYTLVLARWPELNKGNIRKESSMIARIKVIFARAKSPLFPDKLTGSIVQQQFSFLKN